MDEFSILKDLPELLRDISLLIGIWVAIYGIDSWRREHVGKREIELAEETLSLFYESRDIITHIRNPGSYESETKNIKKNDQETESEFSARKTANITILRYNEYSEYFNKIYAMRYRFMAVFGKEKSQPFEQLNEITNQILFAARMLARLWARDNLRTEEQQKQHDEKIDKYESTIWSHYADEDPIKTTLDRAIKDMESTCKNVILGKGTIHHLINFSILRKNG